MGDSGDRLFQRSVLGTRDQSHGPVPLSAHVSSMCLTLITMSVLGACFSRRLQRIQSWSKLPIAAWLLLAIYADSYMFIFTTALLKDVGINESLAVCDGAILMCLTCYMSTKVLIFAFLSEKAWLVRGSEKSRFQSRLYLFNCFAMILPYMVAVCLSFLWRIGYINNQGTCIIGMERRAMLPVLVLEVVLNVLLNLQFLIPIRKLSSYQHGDPKMKRLALRTFIGSCATLSLSLANLIGVLAVAGEPGWVCLMACNADILLSVLVLHWVTAFDGTDAHNTAFESFRHVSEANEKPTPSDVAARVDIARFPDTVNRENEGEQPRTLAEIDELPPFVNQFGGKSINS